MTATTSSKIEELEGVLKRVYLAGHSEGWTGNQQRRDVQHVDAEKGWNLYVQNGALNKAADLLLHLKPVLEENERYREALRDIANAIRCGAETDVMAWARLAEAQKSVARAALSQKGER
jgi:hypothetical protein